MSQVLTGTQLKSSIARDQVLAWIREGRFAPGHRLPSEPALARMLNLNHLTVRRGLDELQERGVIEKRPRVGNFVRSSQPSLVENQIAVVLNNWTSERSPHRAAASLTMAELDKVIDRQSHSLTMLTYGGHLFEDAASAGNVILRDGIKSVILFAKDDPSYLTDLRRLMDAGVKIVLINHAVSWEKLGLFSIQYDEAGALRQIVEKFIALGHRRIGVLLDKSWHQPFYEFYRAQIELLFSEFELGALDERTARPQWDPVALERDTACLEPLFDRPDAPTAMIVPDETFAVGVLRFCHRRGLRIPDDLSIASVQNHTPYVHTIPISSPSSDVLLRRGVRLAARHLLAWMAGKQPPEKEVCLRGNVQWTDSIGPAPAESAVN